MLEHLTDNRFDAINDTNQIEATSCWFDIFLIKHHEYLRHGGNIDLNPSETLRILNSYHEYGVGRGPVTYIDNHDHSTIVNIAGESRGGRDGGWFKTQPAAITLLTSPGAVLIRNGQEFGEDYCLTPPGQDESTHPCGQRVSSRPLRWDTLAQDVIGKTLFGLYKKLIQIRKDHPSLRSPNFFPFPNNHPDGYGAFPGKDVVIYHRFGTGDNGTLEKFIVVVNYSDFDQFIDIPFSNSGQWEELLEGSTVFISNTPPRLFTQKINSNWGRIYLSKS